MPSDVDLQKRQRAAQDAYDRMLRAITLDQRCGDLTLSTAKGLAEICRNITFDAMTEMVGDGVRLKGVV